MEASLYTCNAWQYMHDMTLYLYKMNLILSRFPGVNVALTFSHAIYQQLHVQRLDSSPAAAKLEP